MKRRLRLRKNNDNVRYTIEYMENNSSYVPGVCNINPKEVAYRKKAAIAGFAIAAVVLIGLLFTNVNPIIRGVIVFLPLFVGVIGYFQVKNSFCVSYGAKGQQNATAGSEKASEVTEVDAKQADKRKARSMNLQAFVISLIMSIVVMLIPTF